MITINDLNKSENFFLMAGPCVIEGEDMALRIADKIVGITERLHIPYVFKGSYRKANRSRLDSFTGIGDEKALKILRKVGETFDIPTVTDIHETTEAAMAAEYVDVLQIPAFLCRQTDLLVAAAKTGKIVNIKKGQFLSPGAMQFAVQKVMDAGNDNVMITERGNDIRLYRPCCRFPGYPANANIRFPSHYGCNPFLAATEPNLRRDRWIARPYRDDSESRYSHRHGRLVYRDPPGAKPSQIRRGQYAQTGFIRRSFDTFGTFTPSDPIKNKGPLLKRPLYFLFLRSII